MSNSDYLKSLIRDLEPVEIFDYYDGPKFYSCRDKVGQLYLVYWVDDSEDSTSWLYLRTSKERYESLKAGLIPVAFALANPEEGFAFLIVAANQDFTISEITSDAIAQVWLPPSDYVLELPSQTLPSKTANAKDIAERTFRQVIDISFDKKSNHYEMAAGKLGQILSSLQNLVYALACDPDSDVRRVSEEIKYRNELMVTGLYASSFGVRLQSKGGNLFELDETSRAIESLAELIASLQVPDSIAEELHKFNVLSRSRFKHLLNVLIEAQVSIKTDWGAPSGNAINAAASYTEILQALNKLNAAGDVTKNVVTMNGELVGVDIESEFFTIKIENKEIIKGSLDKNISHRSFDVPSNIVAKIEEVCEIDVLTDKESWVYTLLDFKLTNE